MQDFEPTPKRQPRENLREVLISSFDPTLNSNRGKPMKRPNVLQAASSLVLGGGASFFVGVFAGVASGALFGFAGVYAFDLTRKTLGLTVPGLGVASPMPISTYLLCTLLGAALGLYFGSVLIAPALETRRTDTRRFRS